MLTSVIIIIIVCVLLSKKKKNAKPTSTPMLPGDSVSPAGLPGPIGAGGLSGYAPKPKPGPVTEAAKGMKKSDNLAPKPPVIKPAYTFYKYEPNVMGKWMCLYCDAENADGNVGCVVCGNSRPN